jgi:hypothetical protein
MKFVSNGGEKRKRRPPQCAIGLSEAESLGCTMRFYLGGGLTLWGVGLPAD